MLLSHMPPAASCQIALLNVLFWLSLPFQLFSCIYRFPLVSSMSTPLINLRSVQAFAAVSGSGSASLVLLLTELTGLYAISTVLLIRKQLPLKYR